MAPRCKASMLVVLAESDNGVSLQYGCFCVVFIVVYTAGNIDSRIQHAKSKYQHHISELANINTTNMESADAAPPHG